MAELNITNERITAEDLDRLQDWHLRDERTRQMNTVEGFKNAPIGATATLGDGSRAMKIKIDRFPFKDLICFMCIAILENYFSICMKYSRKLIKVFSTAPL